MHSRPVVMPFGHTLSVRIVRRDCAGAFVSCDGRSISTLSEQDSVSISKSDFETRLIKMSKTSFYATLKTKLDNRRIIR